MFGRRKLAKEFERQFEEGEREAIVAARDAVGHVVTAFMTQPDVYAPKACIVARNPQPDGLPYVVFKLAWDDAILAEYRLDGDAGLIVREVVEVHGERRVRDAVLPWLELSDAGEVPFRALPGIFQEAFAMYWTGRDIPFSETFLVWAPGYGQAPYGDEQMWMVRRFPATGGEGAPAPGELGYVVFPRELITTLFEQRGW